MSFVNNQSSSSMLQLPQVYRKKRNLEEREERDGDSKVSKLEEVQNLNQIHLIDHASRLSYSMWCHVFSFLRPADLYTLSQDKTEKSDATMEMDLPETKERSSLIVVSKTFYVFLKSFKKDVYWKKQCFLEFKETMQSLSLERLSGIDSWYTFYNEKIKSEAHLLKQLYKSKFPKKCFKKQMLLGDVVSILTNEGFLFYLAKKNLAFRDINPVAIVDSPFECLALPKKYSEYEFQNILILNRKIFLIIQFENEDGTCKLKLLEYDKESVLQNKNEFDAESKEKSIDSESGEENEIEEGFEEALKVHKLPLNLNAYEYFGHVLVGFFYDQREYVYLLDLETKETFSFPFVENVCFVKLTKEEVIFWDMSSRSFIKINKTALENIVFEEDFNTNEPFEFELYSNIFISKSTVFEYANEEEYDLGVKTPTLSELGDELFEENMQQEDGYSVSSESDSISFDVDEESNEELERSFSSDDSQSSSINGTPQFIDRFSRYSLIEVYDIDSLNKLHVFKTKANVNAVHSIVYDNHIFFFERMEVIHIFDLLSGFELDFATNYEELNIQDFPFDEIENKTLINGIYFFSYQEKVFFLDLKKLKYGIISAECKYKAHFFDISKLTISEKHLIAAENCLSKRVKYIPIKG